MTTRLGNFRSKRVMVTRDQLATGIFFTVGNWRTQKDYDRRKPGMAQSLKDGGQETPLLVRVNPEKPDKFEIIRGHTREQGFRYLLNQIGDIAFDNLFPKGVSVDVVKVTQEEVALLKQDNANSEDMGSGVKGKLDWTRAAMTMIEAGCSRDMIAIRLEQQTEKLFPRTKDKGNGKRVKQVDDRLLEITEEIAELNVELVETMDTLKGQDQEIIDAANAGLTRAILDRQAETGRLNVERDALIIEIRKGILDRLTNHWNGGPFLDHLMFYSVYGEKSPETPENLRLEGMSYTIKGSNGVVDKAGKAARKDADVKSGFLSVEQRNKVPEGVEFQTAWADLRKRADDKSVDSGEKPARKKVMAAKELISLAGEKSVDSFSKLVEFLTDATVRENSETLDTIISLLDVAEVVSNADPDFWRTQVVSRFMNIREEAKAEAVAAVEPAVETETVPSS